MNRLVALALSGTALVACGTVKTTLLPEASLWLPVPAPQVSVYFASDSLPPHQRVAILHFKGEGGMLDRLRTEAGKLGANAIVLTQMKEDASFGEKVAAAVFPLASFLGLGGDRPAEAVAIRV